MTIYENPELLLKNSATPEPVGTFSKATRFFEHKNVQLMKKNAPYAYAGINTATKDKGTTIGPKTTQVSPHPVNHTRYFESSNNRTFFGIPTIYEGPGPT